MRLHSLSVTAFGPFSDTVDVDFEPLSDAGLFLLCGPTGAGKSSILDAVCFALYGEVPGDRSSAKRLRCDVSPPEVAPRVRLDVSLGDRRFLLTRSPGWQRPKRRGTGTTTQQASVLVEEVVDGVPQHLTHRLDEAGQLVGELLGMNMSQFTQVAMLPQGRFQDFLRARSEERHKLLQKLFRTARFEDVEHWLRDRRLALRRESDTHADRISGLVHRLDEISPTALPTEVDDDWVSSAAADGTLAGWASDAAAHSAGAVRDARARLESLTSTTGRAASALASARELHTRQERHGRATRELGVLETSEEAISHQRARLDAARRALPVAPLHQQVVRARRRLDDTTTALAQARLAAEPWLLPQETTDRADGCGSRLDEQVAAVRDQLARLRSLQPVELDLTRCRADLDRLTADSSTLSATIVSLEELTGKLPEQVARAETAVAVAGAAQTSGQAVGQRVRELTARLEAWARVGELTAELAEARDRLREAVDSHLGLREQWLEVQERRLHGMAAEIALGLAVGGTCPVCGSCEHPEPARQAHDAPSPTEEKAARRRVDDADVVRQAHDEQVRNLETRLAVSREQAGTTAPAVLRDELCVGTAEAGRLAALADGLPAAAEAVSTARGRLSAAQDRLGAARVELSGLTASLGHARDRATLLASELAEALGDAPDLATLITERQRQVGCLTRVLDTSREADAARDVLAELLDDATRQALACGFADLQSGVEAVLESAGLLALETEIAEHDRARAGLEATLADPDLVEAANRPRPDLDTLTREHTDASDALADAEARHRSAVVHAGRIEALRTQLFDALAAWEPVRHAHRLAAELASFAEGKAADNLAQMRLSAYVLSWRLGQVVDAANLRLARMSDQRYALEHTARRGAGETRGGLSLLVRDEWSGESRDPVTLSGGETFVVSLALALGLTDVVTQEAGGADIGTLFVDEGFGSLDAETLDDVMDTLDSLRDGGRVVGIVSHVPELRTRIPVQLQVDKSRSGSSVRQVYAAL